MSKNIKNLVALFVLLSLNLSAISSTPQEKEVRLIPRSGGTLRVKAFTNIFKPQLDPAQDAHYFVLEQIYDGLVRLDKDLSPIPSLADYWMISEDGRKYTFYLKKGVKFHHGRELTAEDVKFSLERLIDKKTGTLYYQFFTGKVVGAQEYWEGKAQDVEGYKVRDKYIFEIQWKKPYVSGLYLMSMYFCKILPKDLVQSQGNSFFMKPSGTGPFKFDYWLRSPKLDIMGVRLVRNDDYYGQKAYLDAVEFSPHYTLDQFVADEVQMIPFLSERLSKGNYRILESGSFDLTFLGMSCHISPLDKPEIRRAILLGIDKKKLAQAYSSLELIPQITNNYIPPQLPGFFPADDQEYNPSKAKQILQEVGLVTANEGPVFILCFNLPKQNFHFKVYKELRDQLAVLGIELKIKHLSRLEEMENLKEPCLFFMKWLMDFPDPENIILPLFSSKSVLILLNFNYSSLELDKLMGEAEVERSWTRRVELFHQMEQILSEDVPAIPLFSNEQRMALQPYVMGVEIPPLGFYYVDAKKIWLDKSE
jgi:ABC-type transport system substrate-binding protein